MSIGAQTICSILSAVLAIAAAVLWLKSASIKTPTKITVGFGGEGGSVQQLGDALRRQSRWSAYAAGTAAIAAILQAIGTLLQVVGTARS